MLNIIELKKRAVNSRLVTDSFWALFGNVVAKGSALAAGIIVARFLGRDIYGEYGIIRNTIMSIAIFSTFGLGYTATKYIAEYKNSKPEYIMLILKYSLNITLIFSGLMAVVLIASANYIAEFVLKTPHLATPLRIVAILVIFNAVTATQIGLLAGFNEFKRMSRINTIIGLSTFVLSVVLTYYWNFNGALFALLFSQILNWLLNYRLVHKNTCHYKSSKKSDTIFLRKILIYSFPIALHEALFPLTSFITSLMLIRLTSYGELGLYTAAVQWNAVILYIPGILKNVILSHFAESQNNNKRHIRIMKFTILFNLTVTSILVLIVLLFSSFISSFYGDSFNNLKTILKIVVFSTIFSSIIDVYAQAYLSKGKNWTLFILKLFRDTGLISLTFFTLKILHKNDGAIILAYNTLIMNAIFMILIILFYKNIWNNAFTVNKQSASK